jgi:hypothetical protein
MLEICNLKYLSVLETGGINASATHRLKYGEHARVKRERVNVCWGIEIYPNAHIHVKALSVLHYSPFLRY